jgi:hypothetical protein
MDRSKETNELKNNCRRKVHDALTTTKPAIVGELLQWQENPFFQEVFIFCFCFVFFKFGFVLSLFILIF